MLKVSKPLSDVNHQKPFKPGVLTPKTNKKRKRKMEESKKKQIEQKWRRLLEAANLDSEKPSRPSQNANGDVKVIIRRKRRIVAAPA